MAESQCKGAPEEEQRQQGAEVGEEPARSGGAVAAPVEDGEATAVFYKTKVVEFLGRSTPIILQNDNGPCPLLAICNVLLLRNNVSLSLDTAEVSQQKLLSLVAERLLDSNCNVEGKDEGYIQNQQRNISDAIDLLPRLASGIDVNVLFRKINDFEFTPECAIFDLFDIGLYHGWIVDPQDRETATAIGSKSYNALVGELVALDTRNLEGENYLLEDNSVDFAAATTAALGVPSPCLSRSLSCSNPPIPVPGEHRVGKGDLEEEEELMRILKLSRAERSPPATESLSPDTNFSDNSSEESTLSKTSESGIVSSTLMTHDVTPDKSNQQELLVLQKCNKTCGQDDNICLRDAEGEIDASSTTTGTDSHPGGSEGSGAIHMSGNSTKAVETNASTREQTFCFHSLEANDSSSDYVYKCLVNGSGDDQCIPQKCGQENPTLEVLENVNNLSDDTAFLTSQTSPVADLHSSPGRQDTAENFGLNPNDIEPLYEGEECILDSAPLDYENREPVYEGEVVLAKQADQGEEFVHVPSEDAGSQQQWHLIRNFLKDNASQLTVYGLFCLQDGLKERELCVFFRNNHFSTMFKYDKELYLLATDQGYINQQDLVWEKLNEVNGDTMFMTGNFKEFTAENQVNHSWEEQNAINEYLALEGSTSGNTTFNSDHQLAMELQKQEFEKQPQRQQPQKLQQPSVSGRPRLVTGPQVSRHSANSSHKQDSRSKDKCTLM
uniref:Protein FAM63A n=1 Tax=Anthurium amnicola TaxID=1678845 RepID=A0A1D1YXN6_9ARAE